MKNILRSTADQLDRLYCEDAAITRQMDDWHEYRQTNIYDVRPIVPPIPELEAQDVYGEIAEREQRLVAPRLLIDDYTEGTAKRDDEVIVEDNGNEIIISADHATDPVRKATGVLGKADHGTAGLSSYIAEMARGKAVLPIGRQTSNANVALEHPVKSVLADSIQSTSAFLSLHGMAPGKITHQMDPSEVHGVLGLGRDPSEESLDLAHDIVRKMKENLGLRFVVGNESTLYPLAGEAPQLLRNDQGELVTVSLAAKGEGTTTSFVRQQNESIPAMQLELSRSIRYLPRGMEYRDYGAARSGVYMGWLATRQMCIMMKNNE